MSSPIKVIGAKPRPRALIQGFDPDEAQAIAALFPTSKEIQAGTPTREAEWDVLVVKNPEEHFYPANHLYVLAIGGVSFGPRQGSEARTQTVVSGEKSIATEFYVDPDLPPTIHQLVQQQLVPTAQRRQDHVTLSFRAHDVDVAKYVKEGLIRPFIWTTEGRILAASFKRARGRAECWALPEGVSEVLPWIVAAVGEWHTLDPERFPFRLDWENEELWHTPLEAKFTRELQLLDERHHETIVRYEAECADLSSGLLDARQKADAAERRLLTQRGDPLVEAVVGVLSSFGFEVRNMDLEWPLEDRREDLRITDSDDPSWNAIAEVRGYKGGAQQNDLLRLMGRFVPRFIKETGREPDAVWYLVNQFIGRDPSSRPPVLEGNPDELKTFEEGRGLALDTSHLFRLWSRVQSGELNTGEVRALLKKTYGRIIPGDLGL